MSIRCPEESLRKIAAVPVVCLACNYSIELTQHDENLDEALVTSSYLDHNTREIDQLERLKSLFARFPESRHRLKIRTETQDRSALRNTCEDPEFEAALRADSELYTLLTTGSFLLPARLPSLKETVNYMEKQLKELGEDRVLCPACKKGRLIIEPNFFETL
jgi:hypothetical protein